MHKAINAKFKKGDKVVSSDGKYHGVVWDVYGDGEIVVKCEEDDPLTRRRFDQNRLKLANWSTANSVVAKAVANARAANSSAEPTVVNFDFAKYARMECANISNQEREMVNRSAGKLLDEVNRIDKMWEEHRKKTWARAEAASGKEKERFIESVKRCDAGHIRLGKVRDRLMHLFD